MAQYIRLLEDRDGAYDHIHVVTYKAGEVYSLDRYDPPISQELLDGFVASGHAVEVDAQGNPVVTPGSKRATKPATPPATKTADAPAEHGTEDNPPAPPIPAALVERLYPAENAEEPPAPPTAEPEQPAKK